MKEEMPRLGVAEGNNGETKEPLGIPEKDTSVFKRENEFLREKSKQIECLNPKKLGTKAASLFAAAAVFMSASSVFAKEISASEVAEEFAQHRPSASLEMSPEGEKLFDWEKIVDKLEISISGEQEETSEYTPNASYGSYYSTQRMKEGLMKAGSGDYAADMVIEKFRNDTYAFSKFYHDKITVEEYKDAFASFERSIADSLNAADFFSALKDRSDRFNAGQKILFLQLLGTALYQSYNYDMAKEDSRVRMGGDTMIGALKAVAQGETEIPQTGMCGNIHTFLVKSAEALGVEAWLQEGETQKAGHVWAGAVRESDNGKEIVFFDYGTLIPTGTLNYEKALGIAERYFGRVDLFGSYIGNTREVMFPVESAAHKKMKEATGMKDAGERMEKFLESGKIPHEEKTLEIKISPDTKEIEFSGDTIGLAVFNFEDQKNPYQSLEEMNAVRGRLRFGGEHTGIEAETTILHATLKDFFKKTPASYRQFDEIVSNLAVDYVNDHALAKGEFGEFAIRYGATVQSAISYLMGQEGYRTKHELSSGMRFVYTNPGNTGKFYIGATGAAGTRLSDFEKQEDVLEETSRTMTLGAKLKVSEAVILDFDARQGVRQWGTRTELRAGVAGETISGRIEHEEDASRYKRFVPDKEKIGAGISYKGGPKWEIDVFGTKTTERYADAEAEESAGAEIKLRIFLW